MPALTVLVDGYNLLLTLARAERADLGESQIEPARDRLIGLLDIWAQSRGHAAVLVWDGRGHAPEGVSDAVRCVFVEPPAEADDWIAHQAEQCVERGEPVCVVTRDRGLQRRLPRGVEKLSMQKMSNDLRALVQSPLTAPHLGRRDDPGHEIPASSGPVDVSRLPRRRVAADEAPRAARPAQRRKAAPAAPNENQAEERGRAAAAERKKVKQARWARAQKRRQAKK